MRIHRGGGKLDMTCPVARMRSMTSRILRRYALLVGSDRPTPRGSDEADEPIIDNVSGVVTGGSVDEIEDVLLLWGLENIGPLGFQHGRSYRHPDKDSARKGAAVV